MKFVILPCYKMPNYSNYRTTEIELPSFFLHIITRTSVETLCLIHHNDWNEMFIVHPVMLY